MNGSLRVVMSEMTSNTCKAGAPPRLFPLESCLDCTLTMEQVDDGDNTKRRLHKSAHMLRALPTRLLPCRHFPQLKYKRLGWGSTHPSPNLLLIHKPHSLLSLVLKAQNGIVFMLSTMLKRVSKCSI